MVAKLDRLSPSGQISGPGGTATAWFSNLWQRTMTAIEQRFTDLQDLLTGVTPFTTLNVGGVTVSTLGNSSTRNVGTGAGTVAAGNDGRITGAAQKANNLSDLASAVVARANLGLAAVAASGSASDLTNGVTGSGAVVLAASPVLSTPNIGAATASKLSFSGAVGAAPNLDASGMTALSVPASTDAVIYPGASVVLLFVTETAVTGGTALWMLVGGAATLISTNGSWVASTTTPAGNNFSISSSGGNYRVYAGTSTGGAFSFKSQTVKIN